MSCAPGYANCNGDQKDGCEQPEIPVACYRDADGDGFGVETDTQTFPCGTCPTGWTAKSVVFDCYDSSKNVFPGQTKWFGVPHGQNNWDY